MHRNFVQQAVIPTSATVGGSFYILIPGAQPELADMITVGKIMPHSA